MPITTIISDIMGVLLLKDPHVGVQPEEVIFIDDLQENVQVAQRIGMHAIIFEENQQAIAALQRSLQL